MTPLALACANGNAEMIRLLLDAGADPNSVDPAGETALMMAARIGNLDAVKVLLDRGAVLDARDREFEQTALMVAVRENHPEVVRLFVERHADVNARTRTGRAPAWVLPNSVPGFGHGIGIVRGGLPERGSRYLIPGGLTPLLYAARDGRLESARILVAAGADVKQTDPNGITPLLMAITNNHMDVARFLIDRGSDVNAVDWYGRTPLWAAVETRNMDVDNAEPFENGVDREAGARLIQYLLDKGADPNTRTKETPPIRRQMLRVTGSLAWVDFTGQSPFLTAALAGDLAVMQLLLDWGADPYVTTFGGTTPLMAAAGIKFPPKAIKQKPAIIAGDDFVKLLKNLREPHRTMVSLIAATGLRIGELLALRWSALDLDTGTLAGRESVFEGKFQSPKTQRALRTIPLGPRAVGR